MYFLGTCIYLNGELIIEMVENAKEITYNELIKYIPEKEIKIFFPDYDWEERTLTLENDYHTSFYKSKYDGRECVYISWSSIEYVWIKE